MTDLERGLTELFERVDGEAEIPRLPLDQVIARGNAVRQRRRRRTAVWAAVAAAVAVVAIIVPFALAGHGTSDAPAPAHRDSPSPSAPDGTAAADGVDPVANARPYQFVVGTDGGLLALFSNCLDGSPGPGACHQWWQVRGRGGASSALLPTRENGTLKLVPGGALLTSYTGRPGPMLRYDGSSTPLRQVTLVDLAGITAADANAKGLVLIDAQNDTWAQVRGDFVHGAFDDGTIWAATEPPGPEVMWSSDGLHWQRHRLPGWTDAGAGSITAHGSRIVAVAARQGDDLAPIAGWSVSSDAGHTWRDVSASSLPFEDADQIVATDDGTLYVSSMADGLFRSTDASWTRFQKVGGLTPAGLGIPGWITPYGRDSIAVLTWKHRLPDRVVIVGPTGPAKPSEIEMVRGENQGLPASSP